MGEKINKIYERMLEGAEEGLVGQPLFNFVRARHPDATSRKVVKASLLALTDDNLADKHILRVIYDLAIKHRLEPVADDLQEDTAQSSERRSSDKLEGRTELTA